MAETSIKVLPGKKLYLYDRIINLTLYHAEDDKKTIKITCPPSGIKPDLTLSVSEIPGNACFQAVVQVRNLMLGDVRKYKSMSIEAGYYGIKGSQMNTITFNMDIFSGYNETPNPDGITTFNGLVVGQISGFLIDRPVRIQVNEDVSYQELIEKVVAGASNNLMKVQNYMDIDLEYELPRDAKGNVIPDKQECDNGYAAIMWLQNKLYELGKKVLGYPIFLIIWNDLAYVIPLDQDAADKEIYSKFPITNLDAVTKASFAGPSLSVIAPWIPQVLPGSLIRMKPNYYTGERLPNTLTEEDIGNTENLYYVIKNEVKFSTVGTTNQMQISAIPVQYVVEGGNYLKYKTPRITAAQMEDLRTKYIEKHDQLDDWEPIIIGDAKQQGSESLPEDIKSFWRYANDDLQKLAPGMDINIGNKAAILTAISDCWSGAAQEVYGSTLWVVKKEDLIDIYGESKYKQICRDPEVDIMSSDKTVGVPLCYFWPLIILGTYWKYKTNNNKGPYGTRLIVKSGDKADELVISMSNPDVITQATMGWVPTLTEGMIKGGQLDSFAPAFISFGKYYMDKYKAYRNDSHSTDKERKAFNGKYVFGKQTYLVGVCLGGYKK